MPRRKRGPRTEEAEERRKARRGDPGVPLEAGELGADTCPFPGVGAETRPSPGEEPIGGGDAPTVPRPRLP